MKSKTGIFIHIFLGEEHMNIYSKLLKQLNMCGHAVLVTDYPSSDTSDGTAASAVCHQTSRKTILSAVPGQMKPDNGTILPVSGSSASCSSVCGTLPPIHTTLAQTALSEGHLAAKNGF